MYLRHGYFVGLTGAPGIAHEKTTTRGSDKFQGLRIGDGDTLAGEIRHPVRHRRRAWDNTRLPVVVATSARSTTCIESCECLGEHALPASLSSDAAKHALPTNSSVDRCRSTLIGRGIIATCACRREKYIAFRLQNAADDADSTKWRSPGHLVGPNVDLLPAPVLKMPD